MLNHSSPRRNLRTLGPALALAFAPSACTTLGPMPGMTGLSAAHNPRPGAEVQVGAVPGFYLSESVREEARGSAVGQASGMIEPGETIGLPGLAIGGRYVDGRDGPGLVEPMLRYRTSIDERMSIAVVGFGTTSSGSAEGASYSLTRGGVESTIDVRLTPRSNYVELHVELGAGVTGLAAEGDYCSNGAHATQCDADTNEQPDTHAEVATALPSFHVGASGDFARHLDLPLHGVRLAVWLGGGFMPYLLVENPDPLGVAHQDATRQDDDRQWAAGGLALSVDFGGRRGPGGEKDGI